MVMKVKRSKKVNNNKSNWEINRDKDIRARTKDFFIMRFGRDPTHPAEKQYFEEWVSRFKTGVPENYMDSQSREVYTKLKFGNKPKYPKGWKGKGGQSIKIVKVN